MKFLSRLPLALCLFAAPMAVQAQTVTVTVPNTVNGAGQPTTVGKTFLINPDGSVATPGGSGSSGVAQGSTTAGQSGPLTQCAVVSGDQAYTAGNTNPVTCTATGRLRIGLSSAGLIAPGAPSTSQTSADLVGCTYRTPVTWTVGWTGGIQCDVNGNLITTAVGNVAAGTTDSGNPVKVGGVYNSVLPTLTAGQRGDVQLTSSGTLIVGFSAVMADGKSNTAAQLNMGVPGSAPTSSPLSIYGFGFNGSTWDRVRTIPGVDGTGLGVAAVSQSPNSNANAGTAPLATSGVASALVGKASAGNLYGMSAVSGASAGYVMLFNATSAPADGAVTPTKCWTIAANSTIDVEWRAVPISFSTGITAVFSTTGCFTKTASATAFISLDAK